MPGGQSDNFDELFQQLKSTLVRLELFRIIRDDYIALFEIKGLVLKLRKLEVPSSITNVILDFEPLLNQVVQVSMRKQESAGRFELRAEILREHQSLVSESQLQVAELEAKAKEKNKMETLEADIMYWTQKINWLHMKIEAPEKEKA